VLTVRAIVKALGRILLVEDDLAIRDALAEVLEGLGYSVRCAGNGAEALELLAREELPTLIVLDLMMPVMDGFAFRRAARRDPRLADIPVMVVSASDLTTVPRLAELEAAAFLAKPFELERFVAEVHRLC
jgi:CheY-like chemotaxis protein